MTYDQLWQRLAAVYGRHEAQAVVRTVLDSVFGMSLTDICCGKVTQLSAEDAMRLEKIMLRLEKSEPVQYVLGEAWFCGRRFTVGPGVLIPRPETEDLADWAVATAQPGARVLDVGTGSGCLAVTLALDIVGSEVEAWDLSRQALDTAEQNARQLGARVVFRQQDALCPPADEERWDLIVSNPPYVLDSERATMHRNVLDHEPATALFVPDHDPLLFYRAIARYASRALKPGGTLLFETNTAFAHDVALLSEEVGMECVEVRNDRYGKPREVGASRRVDKNIS